jgi:hypothetical protein
MGSANKAYEEKELTAQVSLCDDQGRLNPAAVGWSRKPLHICNLSGSWPRKKKWNYWAITSPACLFSVTLTNIDYAGLAFAYFCDFEKKLFVEKTITMPLGKNCLMPDAVEQDIRFDHAAMKFSVNYLQGGAAIKFSCPDLQGKKVVAEVFVQIPPGHETLNVVIPWCQSKFQFTSKQNTLPAKGVVKVDGADYGFDGVSCFACLDFGRGIWPYSSSWNWASFSGRQGDDIIGVNLGAKWTDGTGMNENGVCLNSRLHKISEDMVFEYDNQNFKKPWRLRTSASERVDLCFTPFYERVAKSNMILVRSEVHQCFGRYSGVLRFAGREIKVQDQIGWAEEHFAKW